MVSEQAKFHCFNRQDHMAACPGCRKAQNWSGAPVPPWRDGKQGRPVRANADPIPQDRRVDCKNIRLIRRRNRPIRQRNGPMYRATRLMSRRNRSVDRATRPICRTNRPMGRATKPMGQRNRSMDRPTRPVCRGNEPLIRRTDLSVERTGLFFGGIDLEIGRIDLGNGGSKAC